MGLFPPFTLPFPGGFFRIFFPFHSMWLFILRPRLSLHLSIRQQRSRSRESKSFLLTHARLWSLSDGRARGKLGPFFISFWKRSEMWDFSFGILLEENNQVFLPLNPPPPPAIFEIPHSVSQRDSDMVHCVPTPKTELLEPLFCVVQRACSRDRVRHSSAE